MLGNISAKWGTAMTSNRPRVSERWMYDPAHGPAGIPLDSAAWFAWLDSAGTTGFAYPLVDPQMGYIVGFMSVRKERKQRGGAYWVAYRRQGGQVRKVYLGRSRSVELSSATEIQLFLQLPVGRVDLFDLFSLAREQPRQLIRPGRELGGQ